MNSPGTGRLPIPTASNALSAYAGEAGAVLAGNPEDGSYRFSTENGLYLTSTASGGLKLMTDWEDETLSHWKLRRAYGGWYIVNVGASWKALEYYRDAFTTCNLSYTEAYTFNFYEIQQ